MQFVIPETVTTQFHLREGDKVADFGAGRGFFLKPLCNAVGVTGEVHLCEIQRDLVDQVGQQILNEHLPHASVVWCDLEEEKGIPIDDAVLDAAIIVNTLFQIEDKEVAVQEMLRTLRPGGKLFVIDWSDVEKTLGPNVSQMVSTADCEALFTTHGCVLDRSFPAGAHHYGLAFRKL